MSNFNMTLPPSLRQNGTKGRYASLDGLRAFSAIGIVVMHVLANIQSGEMTCEPANVVVRSFTNFVFLFFIISAFGMSCGYYDRMKNGTITPNNFYKKRYQRILPFFAILTVLGLVMSPSIGSVYESFANLTLCFNLLPNPDIEIIGVGWFLGLIFLFYMLFPFFVFLMDNKRRAWFVLLIALTFHFIAQGYFFTDKFIDFNPQRHNIIFSAPYFIAGGLVYLYREWVCKVVERHRYLVLLVCLALAVGFFFRPAWMDIHVYMMVLFSLWIMYAISVEDKLLSNKVMKYLSGISMEIYLCHMLSFRVVEMAHIERFIHNVNWLYVITFIFTLGGGYLILSYC